MLRLVLFLIGIAAMAFGLAWLADRPGEIAIDWLGRHYDVSVFHAVILFSLLFGLMWFVVSLISQVLSSPAAIGTWLNRRQHRRGLEALSSGMIAIGAGDRMGAARHALAARKSLPNEPLTQLLRAQAAQLSGDTVTARRVFEAMLASPDTEQLGLRGLFLEANREGELEAARHYAERAVALNPKLGWSVDALFELQCRDGDLEGALSTLAAARRNGQIDKAVADRRRAVLLAGVAQQREDGDPEKALNAALEAHGLAADLVPAAAIAGRLLASRGNTPRATKVIQKTWSRSPHPDLATAYAYARIGDSPRDRLTRVKQLTLLYPNSIESPIAVASAAIEAREFDEARQALEPLAESGRLTKRVCLLMARVEGEQGDKGRVREWLARALHAPRDATWTADGVVSDHWAPISPVTGALDAFRWAVPVEIGQKSDGDGMIAKVDELMALGVSPMAAGATAADEDAAAVSSLTAAAAKSPMQRNTARGEPATAADAEVVPVKKQVTTALKPEPVEPAADVAERTTARVPQSSPAVVVAALRPAPNSAAAAANRAAEKAAAIAVSSGTARPSASVAPDATKNDAGKNAAKGNAKPKPGETQFHAPDDPGPGADALETDEPLAGANGAGV